MEKILEQTLLYDFYGELLTEHQRQVYEDVVLNDFSLSEVAAARGISRQESTIWSDAATRHWKSMKKSFICTTLCADPGECKRDPKADRSFW